MIIEYCRGDIGRRIELPFQLVDNEAMLAELTAPLLLLVGRN